MPNWCSNTITITGTEKQIGLLTRILQDEPQKNPDECIVFKTLIGIEPDVSQEDYDNGQWYGSNTSYYGTKWDVDFNSCNFSFNETSIVMSPDTAWSPPINFGVVLHKMYGVDVEMFYAESGVNFCGKTIINEDGVFEEDYNHDEGQYRFDEEYFWEGIIPSNIEYALDEEKSVDEFMEDYPYLDTEDHTELRKIFNVEHKQRQTENNG